MSDPIVIVPPAAPEPILVSSSEAADAYQLAVADGFVGTLTQWLASLKGEQGIQGIQGGTGATGATGAQGVAGTGKEWVEITVAAYDALTPEQKADTTKVYNLTDWVW